MQDITVQKPKRPTTSDADEKRPVTEGIKSTLYNPINEPLADICLPNLLCPYFSSISLKERPQYSQLWQVDDKPQLVATKFGDVPRGSVLSYQQCNTLCDPDSILVIPDAPEPPKFVYPDLSSYCQKFVPLTRDNFIKFECLNVSEFQSREFEQITRDQSATTQWHQLRRNRLTASNFKSVCSRRADFDTLSKRLLSARTVQTAAMKHGIDTEPEAADVYAHTFGRNVYRVGLVINPTCRFLGASPDRRVYDIDECDNPWGLLEIKCTVADTVAKCDYLCAASTSADSDVRQLKQTHQHYYQIMGQLGLTGCNWCDLFVYARDDFHCERVYFDPDFFSAMMLQLVDFFFSFHLSNTQM
jgi:hypothetical protein